MFRILIGLALGAALGAFIGWKGRCATGACPLTSNPYIGGVYGALLGAVFAGLWSGPSATDSTRSPAAEQTAAATSPTGESSMGFVHVDSEQAFDTLVRDAKVPVLVDFWAAWCAPCRIQGKILDDMAADLNGNAIIAKVDVDQVSALAERYGIRSIPTLMVFENGDKKETMVGVQSKDRLKSLLNLGD